MPKLLKPPCNGLCDNCPYPDCIDESGYWDCVTMKERRILAGPQTEERKRVYNRIWHRRKRLPDGLEEQEEPKARRAYYKNAPCDGDCPNCVFPDCVDSDGIWDEITPKERIILNGPQSKERDLVTSRVYHRRRRHYDSEFRERRLKQAREYQLRRRENSCDS